jgi:hypothetical protein
LDEEAHAGVVPASVLRQRQLAGEENNATGERAPLLGSTNRGLSVTRLKRGKSVGKTGDATVTQAVLMVSIAWIRLGMRCADLSRGIVIERIRGNGSFVFG